MMRRRRSDDGAVTAELALGLPTLVLLLAVALWMQSAVALEARCLDAARAGARAAARGDADSLIQSRLRAALPAGAAVGISHTGTEVRVEVTSRASVPAGLSALVSGPVVRASATAQAEPDQ